MIKPLIIRLRLMFSMLYERRFSDSEYLCFENFLSASAKVIVTNLKRVKCFKLQKITKHTNTLYIVEYSIKTY